MIDIIKNENSCSVSLEDAAEIFSEWSIHLENKIQVILDTSLPNKQQHRAASKLLHDCFVQNSVEFTKELTVL